MSPQFLGFLSAGVSLAQNLLDSGAISAAYPDSSQFEVMGTIVMRCAFAIISTVALVSTDALMVPPSIKLLIIGCWIVNSIVRVLRDTGLTGALPAYTANHRFCFQTECFDTAVLRVQLLLTVLVFAVKYAILLWRHPETLTVVRASVTFQDEAAERQEADDLRRLAQELAELDVPGIAMTAR